jgi:hypothetical protein
VERASPFDDEGLHQGVCDKGLGHGSSVGAHGRSDPGGYPKRPDGRDSRPCLGDPDPLHAE